MRIAQIGNSAPCIDGQTATVTKRIADALDEPAA